MKAQFFVLTITYLLHAWVLELFFQLDGVRCLLCRIGRCMFLVSCAILLYGKNLTYIDNVIIALGMHYKVIQRTLAKTHLPS
jgi:hypothetical protein